MKDHVVLDHASAQSHGPEHQAEHESLHGHEGAVNVHSLIGVALVAGFITMLLIDQLCGGSHVHSAPGEEHILYSGKLDWCFRIEGNN